MQETNDPEEKRKRRGKRWEKCLLILMTILAVTGFAAVDGAYADLMQKDGALTLQVKRIDENDVRISLFGWRHELDVVMLKQRMEAVWKSCTDVVNGKDLVV